MNVLSTAVWKQFPWRTSLLLAGILLLGLIFRLTFRNGLTSTDSFHYVEAAIDINQDGLRAYLANLDNIYANRIAIVIPLALGLRLFGISEASTYIPALLLASLTILIAYGLGSLDNRRTGILAALLAATIPQDILYSTAILPDSFIPFYVGACLLSFALAERRRQTGYYFISGFFVFCAFQSRATSGVLLAPLFVYSFWRPQRDWRQLLLPGLSFAACLIGFWVLLFFISGDFGAQLRQFQSVARYESFVGQGEFLGYFRFLYGQINPLFGFFYHLVLVAALYAAVRFKAHARFRLMFLTLMLLYLFFEFGSTTITEYQPIWKQPRFLTILSVPAAVLVAQVADHWLAAGSRQQRLTLFGLLALQLLSAVGIAVLAGPIATESSRQTNQALRQTFIQLSAMNEQDDMTNTPIHAFMPWPNRAVVFAQFYGLSEDNIFWAKPPLATIAAGSMVVYDDMIKYPIAPNQAGAEDYPSLAPLPDSPPANWQLLFTEPHPDYPGRLVYVYRVNEALP